MTLLDRYNVLKNSLYLKIYFVYMRIYCRLCIHITHRSYTYKKYIYTQLLKCKIHNHYMLLDNIRI